MHLSLLAKSDAWKLASFLGASRTVWKYSRSGALLFLLFLGGLASCRLSCFLGAYLASVFGVNVSVACAFSLGVDLGSIAFMIARHRGYLIP